MPPDPWLRACPGMFRSTGCSANCAQRATALATGSQDADLPTMALMTRWFDRRRPLWRQILDRLGNPLVLILLFASGLSAWTGDVTSFAIIVVIILLSVVLDVVQQRRAENTVDALRRSVGLKAQVLREGGCRESAVDRLVPGDVVELRGRKHRAGRLPAARGTRLFRKSGSPHRRVLPRREEGGRSRRSGRGSLWSGELRVHGNVRDQRHGASTGVPDGARDRAWRACRRARGATAGRRLRARHSALRLPDAAPDDLPRLVRARSPTWCSIGPGSNRSCLLSLSPSASRPSFCPWWSR